MSVEQRANEAIQIIEGQLKELAAILDKAAIDRNFDLARQRIQRWKERTVNLIVENISDEEAQKLSEKRMRSASFDLFRNVVNEVEMYTAFLQPLIEELKEHPEDELLRHVPHNDLASRRRVMTGFVFIAMPMSSDDPGLEDVHEAIKEVAADNDLRAERVDDPQTNDRISLRIVESLEAAEFVVADLTHSKPNVYFEAGYAEALGTTPVSVAKKGTDIEFDVKDYPVIFFKNIKELKKGLSSRFEGLKSGAA